MSMNSEEAKNIDAAKKAEQKLVNLQTTINLKEANRKKRLNDRK